MKRARKSKFALVVTLIVAALLVGCGKSDPMGETAPTVPGVNAGVPGTGSGICVPINQPIPFTGSQIYFDWANIMGGQLPYGQGVGQMVIGGGATGGPYQRSGVDGAISMNITPVTGTAPQYQQYPTAPSFWNPTQTWNSQPGYDQNSKTANATGMIQISQQTQQDIMYNFGGGAYTGTTQSMPCVSGIAMNVGHYYTTIYGGNVYLYLNNTTSGYILYF